MSSNIAFLDSGDEERHALEPVTASQLRNHSRLLNHPSITTAPHKATYTSNSIHSYEGTALDPIIISPVISPATPSLYVDPIERSSQGSLIRKRSASPGSPPSPKRVRLDDTRVDKYLALKPRPCCVHRGGLVQPYCVHTLHKGYNDAQSGISALIISSDCVGFQIPTDILGTASPFLFAAVEHHGTIQIPEPEPVVKFLLDCITKKLVPIDVDLANAVSRNGSPISMCGVLVRLYNIAEEFAIPRALRLIRNLLPHHAATNPRLALGFAMRDMEVDTRLAYQAICSFSQADAEGCDEAYWATIARARLDGSGFTEDEAMEWGKKCHATFVECQDSAGEPWWERVAFDFLKAIGWAPSVKERVAFQITKAIAQGSSGTGGR